MCLWRVCVLISLFKFVDMWSCFHNIMDLSAARDGLHLSNAGTGLFGRV